LNVPPDKVVLHFSNTGLQALVLWILRRFPRFVVDSLTFKVFLTPVRLVSIVMALHCFVDWNVLRGIFLMKAPGPLPGVRVVYAITT